MQARSGPGILFVVAAHTKKIALQFRFFSVLLIQVASFGELRYGRFALLTDFAYMKVGINSDFTKSRGVDQLNGSVGIAAGATVKMFIAEMAAAYEIGRWSGLGGPNSLTTVDAYAGGRFWWQHGDLNVSASGTVNVGGLTFNRNGTYTADGTVNWIDPVVGLRLQHRIKPGLDLLLSGDIGGFGAGSDFSWQAIGAISYDLGRYSGATWSGILGYKALYADYSRGSGQGLYQYEITMHGPIIGLSARF